MINIIKLSGYKVTNVTLLVAVLCVNLFVDFKLSSCTNTECLFKFKPGLYDPIITATPLLTVILLIFLFLPVFYFKKWLFYIASWAFPVLLYFIAAESVYTSSIQSGPDFIAQIGMVFIAAITGIFVIGLFVFGWFKRYWKGSK